MASYLGAYYGDALPEKAIEVIAYGEGVEAARQALESAWRQVGHWRVAPSACIISTCPGSEQPVFPACSCQ
jgi:hypothetical protein